MTETNKGHMFINFDAMLKSSCEAERIYIYTMGKGLVRYLKCLTYLVINGLEDIN